MRVWAHRADRAFRFTNSYLGLCDDCYIIEDPEGIFKVVRSNMTPHPLKINGSSYCMNGAKEVPYVGFYGGGNPDLQLDEGL